MNYKKIGWIEDSSNDTYCLIFDLNSSKNAKDAESNLQLLRLSKPPLDVQATNNTLVISVSRRTEINKRKIEHVVGEMLSKLR